MKTSKIFKILKKLQFYFGLVYKSARYLTPCWSTEVRATVTIIYGIGWQCVVILSWLCYILHERKWKELLPTIHRLIEKRWSRCLLQYNDMSSCTINTKVITGQGNIWQGKLKYWWGNQKYWWRKLKQWWARSKCWWGKLNIDWVSQNIGGAGENTSGTIKNIGSAN